MGFYNRVRQLWKKPKANLGKLWQERLVAWRREPVIKRIDKPTRIDRARSLGYIAKQGMFIVRAKVLKGGHTRPKVWGGRRPKHSASRLTLRKNYQMIAEERAGRAYPNCEVLNSYYVAKDGKYHWYEIILVDRAHPAIAADKSLGWISKKQHKRRANRGLTSAGRKIRGLRKKGKGAEKTRPSRSA